MAIEWRPGGGKSTQIGYVNPNEQRCCGQCGVDGNDHLQKAYKLECLRCGYVYGANGSDIHLRLCPECQGGAPGIRYWERGESLLNTEQLDQILERQLVVAWASESADSSFPGGGARLGWWRTDMTDEYGGADLMRRLTPRTWEWAVLEAARLAAIAVDRAARSAAEDPDHLLSLFRLGFEVDEHLAERLRELKTDGAAPAEQFPTLKAAQNGWTADDFAAWAGGAGEAAYTATATGRRLRGDAPDDLAAATASLTAALCPLEDAYPLPHYRLAR